MAQRVITVSLAEKVLDTLERTEHLVSLVPIEQLRWRPPCSDELVATSDLGHLLGHLLDCSAGFCAAFHAAFPEKLAHLVELKLAKVNHFCEPEEWRERIAPYRSAIRGGFRLCTDQDLGRRIKTAFRPKSEMLATILLGNLEHLLNHKYQLFLYLKLLGKLVGTDDLYYLPNRTPRAKKKPN